MKTTAIVCCSVLAVSSMLFLVLHARTMDEAGRRAKSPVLRPIPVGDPFWKAIDNIPGASSPKGTKLELPQEIAEQAFSGTILDHCWDWLQPISAETDGRQIRISIPRLINKAGKIVHDGSEKVDVWIDLSTRSFMFAPNESESIPTEADLMQIVRVFNPARAHVGTEVPDIEISPAISVVTIPSIPPYDPESPDWVGPDFNMRYWVDNRSKSVMFCLDGGD